MNVPITAYRPSAAVSIGSAILTFREKTTF